MIKDSCLVVIIKIAVQILNHFQESSNGEVRY